MAIFFHRELKQMKRKPKKLDGSAIGSRNIRRGIRYWFPLFLLPMVASFIIGFVWPFIQGAFLSFTKFKTTSKWTWVGFDNYIKAFNDESFRYSFFYTAIYAIVSIVFINVLAIANMTIVKYGIGFLSNKYLNAKTLMLAAIKLRI